VELEPEFFGGEKKEKRTGVEPELAIKHQFQSGLLRTRSAWGLNFRTRTRSGIFLKNQTQIPSSIYIWNQNHELIYFLDPEPEVLHKSKELPNTTIYLSCVPLS
jgi:hypothetical protein